MDLNRRLEPVRSYFAINLAKVTRRLNGFTLVHSRIVVGRVYQYSQWEMKYL